LSPVFFSGAGQITAPALVPVPEPMNLALTAGGLAWIAALCRRRRKI
jgi:hypothetical protein